MKPSARVRSATSDEQEALARLWFEAWHDAHACILPAEVVQARTLESFRARLPSMMKEIAVEGEPGLPVGFYRLHVDELEVEAQRGRIYFLRLGKGDRSDWESDWGKGQIYFLLVNGSGASRWPGNESALSSTQGSTSPSGRYHSDGH